MNNYLNSIYKDITFDVEQRNIILNEDKHLIVIAGAGSGKTTTISAKVKYLIDFKKAEQDEILIISLTNKAVLELQKNINEMFDFKIKICTFHKLAYDLLKEDDARIKILSDSEKVLKEIINFNCDTSKVIKKLKCDKIYRIKGDKSLSSIDTLTKFTLENIKLIKTNRMELQENKKYSNLTNSYIRYLIKIIKEYEKYKYINNMLDFDDLIINATKLEKYSIKYKYIIIDEYQDISINRFELFKKIVDYTKANTVVVGDDFQSIYSFSGSKVDLFLRYKDIMNAEMLKITKTYRNSQQLIQSAGNIVMQNKNQIYKKLISDKDNKMPISIRGYNNDFNNVFSTVINEIMKANISGKILVLGRYNSDIKKITSKDFIVKDKSIIYKKNPKLIIEYMTIHASKGLGYDNVILINFDNDVYGFPSNIEENNIKKEIFAIDFNEIYEEERRLLYVALTRTKNNVYILTPVKRESKFIEELLKQENVSINYKYKNKKTYHAGKLIKKYYRNLKNQKKY